MSSCENPERGDGIGDNEYLGKLGDGVGNGEGVGDGLDDVLEGTEVP